MSNFMHHVNCSSNRNHVFSDTQKKSPY